MKASDAVFHTSNYLLFGVFTFLCIYPFYYLFLVSVSSSLAVARAEVILWPVGFTLDTYRHVFQMEGIFRAFMVSAARAGIGTALLLVVCSMFAYAVTKPFLPLRRVIYRAMVFTLYFYAGLIPWVVTMRMLQLNNTFLLYVLPTAVSGFAVVLIKTYMESIPDSLQEAALIDGAGYFTIYRTIIMPISIPILAAVAVFAAVGQWNAWQDNFFLVTNPRLQTIQLVLMRFLREAEMLANAIRQAQSISEVGAMADRRTLDPFTVRATISVITIIPILLVYPFLQKYFVKGIMIGAIKG